MKTQRILVVGASGGTGRHLVLDALARGHHVRAWSFRGDELSLAHRNLSHVAGDARDEAIASAAVQGVDAVISALGSPHGRTKTDVCAASARVLVSQMRKHDVRRLVAITSLGTTAKLGPVHEHVMAPLLRGVYDDKRAQEQIIAGSGLAWVIVRPGRLTETPDRHRLRVVLEGPLPGVRVSRAGLARFALDQLETDAFLGLAPYLVEQSRVPWHKALTLGRDVRAV